MSIVLELFQESDIILVQKPHIVNLVLQQGDTLQAHAEGKARVLLRVLALYPFFFATAFQWNSFKGAKGFASSTLFSTNNLKQFTMAVTEVFLNKDKTHTVKAKFFGCTLLFFHVGVACSFAARTLIGPRSIFCALLPLCIALYTVCLANEWLPLAVTEGAGERG